MQDCSPAPHMVTPNPRRTRLPRMPALCNLTSEHFHQNFCTIFTLLLYAHSPEAKNHHDLLTTLLRRLFSTHLLLPLGCSGISFFLNFYWNIFALQC